MHAMPWPPPLIYHTRLLVLDDQKTEAIRLLRSELQYTLLDAVALVNNADGKSFTIKDGLDREEAERLAIVFTRAGMLSAFLPNPF